MSRAPRLSSPRLARASAVAALFASAFAALPAHALYKVVGPDGKVTYTDRPPVSTDNKVQSVNATTGGPATSGLPYELRQTVQRYPVTLYSGSNCSACDDARRFLTARGVPFSERTVNTNTDAAALQRITGKNELPALTIGSQVISGYSEEAFKSYLDAAAYPARSALPANYTVPAATPLTAASSAPAAAAPSQAPSPAPAASPAPAPAAPGTPPGFKF